MKQLISVLHRHLPSTPRPVYNFIAPFSIKVQNESHGSRAPVNSKRPQPPESSLSELLNPHSPLYWRSRTDLPSWQRHRLALREKFDGAAWRPPKRVSRSTMEKIRFLHRELPGEYNTAKLAQEFKITSEAVRRILKSRYVPTPEVIERQEKRRKERIESRRAAPSEKTGEKKSKEERSRKLGWEVLGEESPKTPTS
ncbi:uncharacterized protein VTP21DRAFT_8330 [Calcarisporiella thermophila]|uniref:uncharacterized protein n=1 Tax=Calcarisporiella thermophila TaxID=911321 RepID=UPI003743BEE0